MSKPFAPSCERNQGVILEVLKSIINTDDKHLLEIGSGTGQHAVFMAPYFSQLRWHTSDLLENHEGIKIWVTEAKYQNISAPIEYQAGESRFPDIDVDVVLTANTLHIMSWENVKEMIKQLGNHLKKGAQIVIYGPFNYGGQYTSESNAKFDVWLKNQEAHRGIRDFESIVDLMTKAGISLQDDMKMPANNRILHFVKN
ncbi:MAG: DUF938 domain-containing protein [Alcanivoracaceae bacterium]|nr:DUF938 domain-containing protein [Alcanivoracaceae bacterium]